MAKACRFSISWARLLPEGTGRINEKAAALYRNMILEMKKNGIIPYLTLYHWELPQALQEKGGRLNPSVTEWFGEYAKVAAERFSHPVFLGHYPQDGLEKYREYLPEITEEDMKLFPSHWILWDKIYIMAYRICRGADGKGEYAGKAHRGGKDRGRLACDAGMPVLRCALPL